jgi:hypothetical protein
VTESIPALAGAASGMSSEDVRDIKAMLQQIASNTKEPR